jgi:hypothetical protein
MLYDDLKRLVQYKSQPGYGWLLLRKGEKEIDCLPFYIAQAMPNKPRSPTNNITY